MAKPDSRWRGLVPKNQGLTNQTGLPIAQNRITRLRSLARPKSKSYMFSEIGRVCSEALARRGR